MIGLELLLNSVCLYLALIIMVRKPAFFFLLFRGVFFLFCLSHSCLLHLLDYSLLFFHILSEAAFVYISSIYGDEEYELQ